MVRIWKVPIEELKSKRFLGLHNETGVAYNSIVKMRCWLMCYPNTFSFLRKNCKRFRVGYYEHGNVRPYHEHVGQLVDLHDNIIVPDFERRGYKHSSPLVTFDCPVFHFPHEKFAYSQEEYEEDHKILIERQK